jgi:hypothetical protein
MRSRLTAPVIALIAVVFLAVAAVPIMEDPSWWVLGDAEGRGPYALWATWTRAEMWVAGAAAPQTGFPQLSDPPNPVSPAHFWLFAALTRLTGTGPAGAALAWNFTIITWLCLGIVGTVALIRRVLPHASAIVHGVAITAIPASLGWSGAIVAGDVADLPALLIPAHLALLHRWVGKERDLLSGLGAAVLLALAVLTRWQMSFFVLAMTLPLGLVVGRHIHDRAGLRRWAMVLLPGTITGIGHIWISDGVIMPGPTASAAYLRAPLSALFMADQHAWLSPWFMALPALGILILALISTLDRPLKAAGWWLCAAWGVLLAGGTTATPYIAPGRRLSDLFDVLQSITDWSMVAPLIAIPVGVLAARGAAALEQRHTRSVAAALALAALADQSHHLIGIHTEDRRFEVRPTRVAAIAFEGIVTGAVLELPFAPDRSASRGEALLDQRMHRMPVSISTSAATEGALTLSYLARLTLRMQLDPGPLPSPEMPLQPQEFLCAAADIDNLIDLGFTAVAYRGLPDPAHPSWQTLALVLGAPTFRDRTFTVWSLHRATSSTTKGPCPLPPIPAGFTPGRGISPGGDERPSSPPGDTPR